MRKRICLIGLDGVGLRNLNSILSSLTLNRISLIVNKGFVSSFTSIPPYTPSTWTSIFSGVNPGKHGIFGFFKVVRSKGEFKVSLANSFDIMYPRIFEILSFHGLKSIIVNVPLVLPIKGIIGHRNLVVVSDWASPIQLIYPRRYEDKYREFLIKPPHEWWAIDERNYIKKIESFLENRINMYLDLLERVNFNLYIIVFSELDWIMHKVPDIIVGRRVNLVYKVCSLIESFVHKAIELCDLVILISDHGFRIAKMFLSINSILAEKNLLSFGYRLNLDRLFRRKSLNLKYNSKLKTLGSIGKSLQSIFRLVKSNTPGYLLDKLVSVVPLSIHVDYLNSKAFMIESETWGIYVKEKYRKLVKHIFKNIGLVRNVLDRETLYWGPFTNLAPDVILIPKGIVAFDARIYSEPTYRNYLGVHHPQALIALYGDEVLPESSIGELHTSMYDIVPTILAYLGLPIPSNTDGRPLVKLFTNELPVEKFEYLQRFKMLRRIKQATFQ